MNVFVALALMIAQATSSPEFERMLDRWNQANTAANAPETKRLGPGPHTLLVISARGPMTKFEYRSGSACQKALDSIFSQTGNWVNFRAFCVPR